MEQHPRLIDVSPAVGQELLHRAGVGSIDGLGSRPIKSGNRVFELTTASDVFYVKLPAKDFVDTVDRVVQASTRVVQEWAAWECLNQNGLPAVDVLAVEGSPDNPVGWPYLLTRGLVGRPLLEFVRDDPHPDWPAAMAATGAYLAGAHAITFERVGHILTPHGPAPDPAGRAPKSVHDPAEEQAAALRDLDRAREFLDDDITDELAQRFHRIAETIAPEYRPPRFVHAAFHANHPYIDGALEVTGVVDMDNASSGAVFDDLTTIATGMMVDTKGLVWWEPFFDGYGTSPDFERFRLALLATCLYSFGEETALQDVKTTYRALLAAESWAELFNANRSISLY